jgi:hypothetical protein
MNHYFKNLWAETDIMVVVAGRGGHGVMVVGEAGVYKWLGCRGEERDEVREGGGRKEEKRRRGKEGEASGDPRRRFPHLGF